MSFWDYLLPWKAIPKMVDEVKDASTTKGKGKYDSPLGVIGKYGDPFGALLGDNVQNFMHSTIPREANRAMQPWNELHMKYLDPLTMSGVVGKTGTDAAKYKGADLTALALGGTALGMAMGGAGGAGAGGGGAGGGAGGSGTGGSGAPWSQNWGAMDWSDPNTYMQLGQQYGGMMPQGGQQPQQEPPRNPGLPPPMQTSMPRPIGSLGFEEGLEALRSRRYRAPRW